VDTGDQLVTGENYSSPLERERQGGSLRGGERETGHSKTLGILRVAQVLRLSLDMIARVPNTISYSYVEN
jgi:hypothetical protein